MSGESRTERARRWLGTQLEELKSLRNAKSRDSEFKQWRQATLTFIQRIWPGDGKRSARFRKIPFTPPSTRAEAREIREYYERGCAEAAQLLQGFLGEIETGELPAEDAPARPPSLENGMAEDDFPTLDLPNDRQAAAESRPPVAPAPPQRKPSTERRNPARRSKRGAPRRRLRDMLGLDDLEQIGRDAASDAEESDIAVSEEPRTSGSSHEDDIESVRAEAPSSSRVPEDEEDDSPPRMSREDIDLDPFEVVDDDEASADEEEAAEAAEDEEDEEAREDEPTMDAPAPPREIERAPEAVEPPAAQEPEAVPVGAEEEPGASFDDGDAETLEERESEEAAVSADDFLSASPVFMAKGKPVQRSKAAPARAPAPPVEEDFEPAPLTTATAMAVAAIAAEVARLGVPEGHRARTRASLINLAQMVEDGELDWEGLRSAIAFAMEFPPVGRRVLPLMIPFLDRAA